jgi:hypothetical protein
MTQAERIAELEREVAARDRRISALEQQLLAMPQSADMTRTVIGRTAMPTEREMTALCRIVTAAHPCLMKRRSFDDAQFGAAFRYVASLTATAPGKFSKLSNMSWVDRANAWLNARGLSAEVTLGAFVAAVLAFNVETTFDDARFPYDLEVGVTDGGNGMQDIGWRSVLRDGLRVPAKIARPLAASRNADINLTPNLRSY